MKRFHITKCVKRTILFAFTSVMALSMASCGSKGGETDNNASGQKEFVYVPEYISLEDKLNINYYNMKLAGNSLYYTRYYHNDNESGI